MRYRHKQAKQQRPWRNCGYSLSHRSNHFCSSVSAVLCCFIVPYLSWWAGLDLNQRTPKRTDLQSARFNHLHTYPKLGRGQRLRACVGLFIYTGRPPKPTLQSPMAYPHGFAPRFPVLETGVLLLDDGYIGCAGGICTHDLQLMRLPSYYCSTTQWRALFPVVLTVAQPG